MGDMIENQNFDGEDERLARTEQIQKSLEHERTFNFGGQKISFLLPVPVYLALCRDVF